MVGAKTTPSVLLVEDEPNDILLTRRAFKKAQLQCDLQIVSDGDSAVDYLAGQNQFADRNKHPLPTLMLLDLKLPRRSGHEILEWVRNQPGLKRLPVVVLTSSKESDDLRKAYDLGANSYLLKPVDFDEFLSVVHQVSGYWLRTNEPPPLY